MWDTVFWNLTLHVQKLTFLLQVVHLRGSSSRAWTIESCLCVGSNSCLGCNFPLNWMWETHKPASHNKIMNTSRSRSCALYGDSLFVYPPQISQLSHPLMRNYKSKCVNLTVEKVLTWWDLFSLEWRNCECKSKGCSDQVNTCPWLGEKTLSLPMIDIAHSFS